MDQSTARLVKQAQLPRAGFDRHRPVVQTRQLFVSESDPYLHRLLWFLIGGAGGTRTPNPFRGSRFQGGVFIQPGLLHDIDIAKTFDILQVLQTQRQ